MKIVVLDGHALNPGDLSWDFLNRFGSYTLYERTDGEDLTIARIGDAQIVLLNKVPITASVLDACPSVKLICVLATGYNVVDVEAAHARGVTVCNVPDYGTDTVAQYTFALLLALCHRVEHHSNLVHAGRWASCPDFSFWDTPQTELAGKTMGIIGFGRIGQAVAKIALAFGMQVLAYSRTRKKEFESLGIYTDLDTLLRCSDIISLHCPLNAENERMINAETINKMKEGTILLNTARGGLVDEDALLDALQSGKLKGAACDVVSQEPMDPSNPLLQAPNCIITPHMAWGSIEARKRIIQCTTSSIQGYLDGKPINTV